MSRSFKSLPLGRTVQRGQDHNPNPGDGVVYRAGWVFPVESPPIADGCVWIKDGKIKAVGSAEAILKAAVSTPVITFPCSALIPGFVNAHAHLELSAMPGCLPRPAADGGNFAEWIRRLLQIRESWSDQDFVASTEHGIQLLKQAGVTTVADITSTGLSLEPVVHSGLRAVVFREVLGFGKDRAAAASKVLRGWMSRSNAAGDSSDGRVSLGISPHAPHSTGEEIYRDCVSLARQTGCLLATHLSETLEEIELLQDGTGPYRRLLEDRRHDIGDWRPPGVSPVRYLQQLGALSVPGLAIHLNYLCPGDRDILKSSQLMPVYCPQSHAFLGHTDHPVESLLEGKTPVALGTDSLASNDNLEMLEEIRLAHRTSPQVPLSRWFAAATIKAARGLGLQDKIGSLAPGKCADIAVFSLETSPSPASLKSSESGSQSEDPHLRLIAPGSRVAGSMVAGIWLDRPEIT